MAPLTQGLLIFLVVLWAAAAVFHCTGLFGYGFF